jgi:hypothetical protein
VIDLGELVKQACESHSPDKINDAAYALGFRGPEHPVPAIRYKVFEDYVLAGKCIAIIGEMLWPTTDTNSTTT